MKKNFSSTSRTKGIWVSVEGVEGTGKTAVSRYLEQRIPEAVLVPEFSRSEVGQLLRKAVIGKYHVITPALLGQSLLFLSDFFMQYETIIAPACMAGKVVISDRGFLSKYVYQFNVLLPKYGDEVTRRALEGIFAMIYPPDLVIYLDCERETIKSRLLSRDGDCSEERCSFIWDAQAVFHQVIDSSSSRVHTIRQTSATTHEAVQADVDQIIDALMKDGMN